MFNQKNNLIILLVRFTFLIQTTIPFVKDVETKHP